MQFRIRCALGATVLSVAALAAAPAAQAQPTVCSTPAFRALDAAVKRNPQSFAGLLGLTYRFAPRQSVAGFDTFAQCDASTAGSLFTALQRMNPTEASSLETYFTEVYGPDPAVFGSGGGGGGITAG